MNNCRDIDTCSKINSLLSRDWAFDDQFREAANKVCAKCNDTHMENNGYDRIVVNTNSWKWTQPLEQDDVVLGPHK